MNKERNMLIRDAILDEIDDARSKQYKLWGNEFDDRNTPDNWVTLIVRRVAGASDTGLTEEYRSDMVKVATICVAAIEAFDRKETL